MPKRLTERPVHVFVHRQINESFVDKFGMTQDLLRAAEECAGRQWDGSEEDARRLFDYYMNWPGV